MAFGQPTGPPATARQLRDLASLVEAAGHSDFRDARGPLGLTQRQAGGRFTRDEAAGLIARLETEADDPPTGGGGPTADTADTADTAEATAPDAPVATRPDRPPAASRRQSLARQLERVPEDLLVDELRRRGWTVTPP
jgi:hypothetical protein